MEEDSPPQQTWINFLFLFYCAELSVFMSVLLPVSHFIPKGENLSSSKSFESKSTNYLDVALFYLWQLHQLHDSFFFQCSLNTLKLTHKNKTLN